MASRKPATDREMKGPSAPRGDRPGEGDGVDTRGSPADATGIAITVEETEFTSVDRCELAARTAGACVVSLVTERHVQSRTAASKPKYDDENRGQKTTTLPDDVPLTPEYCLISAYRGSRLAF